MELLFFFGAMAIFFAVVFAREAYSAKKREKKFIDSLYTDYGNVPDKEYALERFVRIPSYYEKHKKGRDGGIDDITWNDLNMDEIFKRMNYTFSASGEEYLYDTLRNAGKTEKELEHLEEVIVFFQEHPDERVRIQYIMSQLGYTGKYSLYDYIDNLGYLGARSNKKHYLLDFLFLPLLLLLPFKTSLGIMGLVGLIVYNITSYFKEKKEIDPYILSFAYILRLVYISEKLLKIKVPVCEKEWESIRRHRSGLLGLKRGAFIVLTSGMGKISGNPFDVVLDYLRMVFHLDLIKFNKMLAQLRNHIEDVDALISTVGFVETAIAIGAFRKSLPEYCIPKVDFANDNLEKQGSWSGSMVCQLTLTEAYHPLIVNPVKNSITTEKGVLLTGSNASGKSTFLKTVALNAILAQTIHTCTAQEYKAPVYRIFSSMSLRDDLESGDSYYIVEIKALKRILDGAGENKGSVLCFVDEVLRGTNTVERIAASTQILKSLSANRILCFAATHDIELTRLLYREYDNYHFEEEIKEGDIFFNYKLLPGRASTRNAIKLLEIMGYDRAIIEKATSQAEHFVETGEWEEIKN
ncbi:MAG: hypothetical protein J6A94_03295 [Lachnospiraceae bacterium]|nr:hypothetical protein [Lachnospiraceae bacterium]